MRLTQLVTASVTTFLVIPPETLAFSARIMPSAETSDNLSMWNDRWKESRTGWHIADVNENLTNHEQELLGITTDETCSAESKKNVLISLCGKTVDMAYLATKYKDSAHIFGVDGISKALETFAQEQPALNIKKGETTENGLFETWQGESITLMKGDFFQLNVDSLPNGRKFDAIFDRASMVAINPKMRKDYVNVMGNILTPGGTILLVTLERFGSEEARAAGPPFSISDAQVRELYEAQEWVESVTTKTSQDAFSKDPAMKERMSNVDGMNELVFIIKAKK